MRESVEKEKRWVSVAFTSNGLRALGVDAAALGTFPQEFREGMVARATMLGDTGANDPSHWADKTASPDLHAIAILFARDAAEQGRCVIEHAKAIRSVIVFTGEAEFKNERLLPGGPPDPTTDRSWAGIGRSVARRVSSYGSESHDRRRRRCLRCSYRLRIRRSVS
jgi:hypothetical protein